MPAAPPGGAARRALGLLVLVFMCTAISRSIPSVLVQPIKAEFHLTDSGVGLIIGLSFALLYGLAGLPMGFVADRCNRRNLLAGAVAFWGVATSLAGLATLPAIFALGRACVGVGEAAGAPAALSIISDHFPPEKRATAFSIYHLGMPVGQVIAFGLGAYVAAHYGWRAAMLIAGVPSILTGALLMGLLKEPVRGAQDFVSIQPAPYRQALRQLLGQRAVLHLVVSLGLSAFITTSMVLWITAFLTRSHGVPLARAGPMVALSFALASAVGIYSGGWLADFLGRRDTGWRSGVIAVASFCCIFLLAAALLAPSIAVMLACFCGWAILSSMYYGPIYSLTLSLIPASIRATGAALIYLTQALASGIGPVLVGNASDALAPIFHTQSLRYALLLLAPLHAWTIFHLLRPIPAIRAQLTRASALA